MKLNMTNWVVESLDFGPRVKCIREELGISQRQLAASLGMLPETLRKYEAVEIKPKAEQITRFARGMNVNSYLLEEGNYKYVKLETEGDLIALFYEAFRYGVFCEMNWTKKKEVTEMEVFFHPAFQALFKEKSTKLEISNERETFIHGLQETRNSWLIVYGNDLRTYREHPTESCKERLQFVSDDISKRQISWAMSYSEPLPEKFMFPEIF